MSIRETPTSLRRWFATSGVVSWLFACLLSVCGGDLRGVELAFFEVAFLGSVLVGAGHLIAACRLPGDLPTGARWIQHMLSGELAVLILGLLLAGVVRHGVSDGFALFCGVLGIALTAYLLANLRRLARAAERPTAPIARTL